MYMWKARLKMLAKKFSQQNNMSSKVSLEKTLYKMS